MPEPTTRASGDDPMTTATAEMFMRQRDDLAAQVDALRGENERHKWLIDRYRKPLPDGGANWRERAHTSHVRACDAEAEVERLRRWKAEAIPVMSGLQDLGRALGVPLGRSITAAESAQKVDALRARVEELEAGLRVAAVALDVAVGFEFTPEQSYEAATDAARQARALLSDGSQEPRPDTHTAECEHHAFMHHAATGGDVECVCPRPDTDETLPYHLRADASPLAACDRCARKSWDRDEVDATCAMPRPGGSACGGRMTVRRPDTDEVCPDCGFCDGKGGTYEFGEWVPCGCLRRPDTKETK